MASVKVEYSEYRTPAACDCCGDDWGCVWKVLVDGEEIASGDSPNSTDALEGALKAIVEHYGHTAEIVDDWARYDDVGDLYVGKSK